MYSTQKPQAHPWSCSDGCYRVASEQKDCIRTVRHAFTNVLFVIEDEGHAILKFGNLNYSGGGIPPSSGLVGPTLFSDCQMKLRGDADGQWRVTHHSVYL